MKESKLELFLLFLLYLLLIQKIKAVCTNGISATPTTPAGASFSTAGLAIGQIYCYSVTGSSTGNIWWTNAHGPGTYSYDSTIAKAAVHAGILTVGATGPIKITIYPNVSNYIPTTQNGISSNPSGSPMPFGYSIDSSDCGCASCDANFVFRNGSCCDPSCGACSTSGACTNCSAGLYLYSNSSCLANCPLPYITTTVNGQPQCNFPCSGSTPIAFMNGTCTSTCLPPSILNNDGFIQTCIYHPAEPATTQTAMQAAGQTAGQVGSAATTAMMAINSGSPQGLSVSIIAKMSDFIKFINASHSAELEDALNTNGIGIPLSPDFPASLGDKIENNQLPWVFAKYGLQSSFFINFWENLFKLSIILATYLVLLTSEYIQASLCKKFALIEQLRRMVQNMLLATLYDSFGDVVFFSVLDLSSTGSLSGWNLFSFVLSCGFVLTCLIFLIIHIWLLLNQHNIRKQKNKKELQRFSRKYKNFQFLFEGYKTSSIFQQGFLLMIVFRDLFFSLILSTLYKYPLFEISFILGMNVLMLFFLLIKRPQQEFLEGIQQILGELYLIGVNSSVLVLVLQSRTDSIDKDLIATMGNIIIILGVVFNMITLGLLIVKIIVLAWQYFKEKRDLKKKETVSMTNSSMRQNTQVAGRTTSLENINPNRPRYNKTRISRGQSKLLSRNVSQGVGIAGDPFNHHVSHNSMHTDQSTLILSEIDAVTRTSMDKLDRTKNQNKAVPKPLPKIIKKRPQINRDNELRKLKNLGPDLYRRDKPSSPNRKATITQQKDRFESRENSFQSQTDSSMVERYLGSFPRTGRQTYTIRPSYY